jgi:hypothetical protein
MKRRDRTALLVEGSTMVVHCDKWRKWPNHKINTSIHGEDGGAGPFEKWLRAANILGISRSASVVTCRYNELPTPVQHRLYDLWFSVSRAIPADR